MLDPLQRFVEREHLRFELGLVVAEVQASDVDGGERWITEPHSR